MSEPVSLPVPKPLPARPHFLPLSIVRAAWKQKTVLLSSLLLLALAGTSILYFMPASYRSETLILVEAQRIPERLVNSTVNVDLQDRLATIQQQILSTTRLQKIIDKHGLYVSQRGGQLQEEAIESMRRDIVIKLEKGWSRNRPGAIRVTYSGRSPATVAAVANDLGNLFIEENLRSREQQAEGTSEFMAAQMKQARKQLEEYEAKLTEYKKTHSGELPDQSAALLSTIGRLQMDLQARQEAMIRAQQNKVMLETSLHGAESTLAELQKLSQPIAPPATEPVAPTASAATVSPATAEPSEPAATVTKKRSEVLEQQLAAIRLRYSEKHPMIKALRSEIEMARMRESREVESRPVEASPAPAPRAIEPPPSRPPVSAMRRMEVRDTLDIVQARERVATLKAQLDLVEREVEQRQRERDQISQEMASAQSRLNRIPIHEQQLLTLVRDYETASSQYKGLNDKNFSADMAAEMERRQQAERFAVLEAARVPERPYWPDPRKGALVVGLGALALSGLIAFLLELRNDVVLGEWELPEDIVILGRVPNMS